MSLGFEFPERARIMETFCPLRTMSVAEPGTSMHKGALLSLSSGWHLVTQKVGLEEKGQ